MSTRKQLYWNTLLKIPTQIISFGISIVVARILVPGDFGIMGIAMMLIGYANLFTAFGFSEAIIQKGVRDSRTINSIFTFNLAVSSALAVLFYLLAGQIAIFFQSPECELVIKVLSVYFVITAFSAIPNALLRRDMDFKTLSIIELGGSFLMSVLTLMLALNAFGYWALVYGQLIPTILVTAFLCFKVRWVPGICFHLPSLRGIFDFGLWNFLKTQLGFVAQHTDKFIVGKWIGAAGLGLYDKAVSIAELPYNSIIMNINGVMFSSFSKAKDDKAQLQQQFKKSLSLLSLIHFPICCGLIVIAPYFVHYFLGTNWVPMILPFQIVLAGGIFRTFSGMTASLNVGIGQYRVHTLLYGGAWLFFVVACLVLVEKGIAGVALSYVFYNLCLMLASMNLSLRSIELRWRDALRAIMPGAAASLLMTLLTGLVSYLVFPGYSLLNLLAIVLTGAFSYCLLVLLDRSESTRDLKVAVFSDMKRKLL